MANDIYTEKLDKIQDTQTTMQVQLGEYNVILKDHMKRTEMSEHRIENIEKTSHSTMMSMHTKIDKKADRSYITWALGVSTTLVALAVALSKMIG